MGDLETKSIDSNGLAQPWFAMATTWR